LILFTILHDVYSTFRYLMGSLENNSPGVNLFYTCKKGLFEVTPFTFMTFSLSKCML